MNSFNVKYSGDEISSPIGSPGGTTLKEAMRRKSKHIKLGTWNIRGLLQPGKMYIIEEELTRCNIPIAGLSETHWRSKGHFTTKNNNTVYFSGHETQSRNGVALVVTKFVNNCVIGYNPINDRIISLKINATPFKINIIQVYAPTSDAIDEDIDNFYMTLESQLQTIPNKEIVMIIGDFNAKVGETMNDDHMRRVVGKFGTGIRNNRGDRLLQFCVDNSLSIANTLFKQHVRRLYTWQSPDGKSRNQIDFILIRQRWRTSIRNVKTYPGAECGSDHRLLVANFHLKLKVHKKNMASKRVTVVNTDTFLNKLKAQTYIDSRSRDNSRRAEITSNELWETTKKIILDSVNEQHAQRPIQKHKTWISERTLEFIEERKQLHLSALNCQDKEEKMKHLCRVIQRECRKDKNEHLRSICTEIQKHADKNNSKDLFMQIRNITRQFAPRTWAVKDEDGEVVTEIQCVLEIWRKHCENLYKEEEPSFNINIYSDLNEQEPSILRDEVVNSINKLKNDKVTGGDGITAEIIKCTGDFGVDKIHEICQNIWNTCKWPNDWTKSVFIPLHKKGAKDICKNYRLISLLSHSSKIFLNIINERLKSYLSWQIPVEQAGFVKGRGTREHILNLRQIIEKAREFQIPLYICFVDYKTAFDSVQWDCLWKILLEMGVPHHLVLVIKSLYESSSAVVQIDKQISNPLNIKKGVRQGCIISPILFNIYGEYIMRKTLDHWDGGFSIGGVRINNLRYADDTILLASSETEIANLLNNLEEESRLCGLEINYSKTNIMIVDRRYNNRPDIQQIRNCKTVDRFIYLGSLVTNEGGCEPEIRRRIEMGRNAMGKLQKLWKDSDITIKTKMLIVRTLVFPIMLYGAETWTLKTNDRRRIEAFEMWCWRRMLRIPWTAKRTNVSILNELGITQRLSSVVYARILKYFGHLTRTNNNGLEKLVIQGKVEGSRPRGRAPTRWADQVKDLTGETLQHNARAASNRSRWRQIVQDITSK